MMSARALDHRDIGALGGFGTRSAKRLYPLKGNSRTHCSLDWRLIILTLDTFKIHSAPVSSYQPAVVRANQTTMDNSNKATLRQDLRVKDLYGRDVLHQVSKEEAKRMYQKQRGPALDQKPNPFGASYHHKNEHPFDYMGSASMRGILTGGTNVKGIVDPKRKLLNPDQI